MATLREWVRMSPQTPGIPPEDNLLIQHYKPILGEAGTLDKIEIFWKFPLLSANTRLFFYHQTEHKPSSECE